jgi:hypothetical protein
MLSKLVLDNLGWPRSPRNCLLAALGPSLEGFSERLDDFEL